MQDEFEIAKSLQAAGQLEEAETAYRRIIEQDPESFKAMNNLGNVLELQDSCEDAIQWYRRALECSTEHAIIYYNLGHALHSIDRPLGAIACYLDALERDPEMLEAQFNLGVVLYEQGRLDSAEAALRRATQIAPDHAESHVRFGDTLFGQGRAMEALEAYRAALRIDPEDAASHFHEAKSLEIIGRHDEAVAAYRRSLEHNPNSCVAREALASLLSRMGSQEQATAVYRDWLVANPDDSVAGHMLAALTGENVPERADDAYVQQTFDLFAVDFEATLAKLEYQAPKLLVSAVARLLPEPASRLHVLDAGCGTGLCGELLRLYASQLVGVDLSAEMLRKASRREVYDELEQAELTSHLGAHSDAYDLIVASDTLNYFGSLDPVLKAAAQALRGDGILAFTLERDEDSTESWCLQPNGRYRHTEAYLRSALDDAELTLRTLDVGTLRRERGQAVHGWIVTAQLRHENA